MAAERKRVIVYGDSVILAGVQASLEADSGFEVLAVGQPLDKPLEEFRRLRPAAIIFDLGATSPEFLLPLLQQSGLLLIGIDPETHRALVWSGMQLQSLNTQELVQAIAAHAGPHDHDETGEN